MTRRRTVASVSWSMRITSLQHRPAAAWWAGRSKFGGIQWLWSGPTQLLSQTLRSWPRLESCLVLLLFIKQDSAVLWVSILFFVYIGQGAFCKEAGHRSYWRASWKDILPVWKTGTSEETERLCFCAFWRKGCCCKGGSLILWTGYFTCLMSLWML